jgi:HD-like signal output (HDOD) protein/CheY-like chemotaxis protein
MKKRILFVDDEPDILTSLRRMLRQKRGEWEMVFCESGAAALEKCTEDTFDVVVSDIRMPEMDGVELLTRIQAQYPQTVRIALSGHSEPDALLRAVGPTHQFLAKPCNADILTTVIARSCALRDLLSETSLVKFATDLGSLPSLPSLYTAITDELKLPQSSLKKVGEIISTDIGMTAKILQLVNSSFFGIPRHISSPAQAVGLLGMDTIRPLVLSLKLFSEADSNVPQELDLEQLWHHSYLTSMLAKEIAVRGDLDKKLVDDVYLASLLHNVGVLVLALGSPEQYSKVLQFAGNDTERQITSEQEEFGRTHAEIGGYLMGLWGLPDTIVEAIYFQHSPGDAPGTVSFSPLTAVHVATALVTDEMSENGTPPGKLLDMDYLNLSGLADEVPVWREMLTTILASGENSE